MENQTYTLLLVDDDSFLVDMYSVKFSAAGHKFRSAASGEDAMEILRGNFKPDAVIIDLVMPDMNGFELMERIRSENLAPGAAFIVLSNQSESADIERIKQLGAIGHIVKANAIPSEVLSLVVRFIEKHKERAQPHSR